MSISRITASILRPLSKEIIQALGEIGVSSLTIATARSPIIEAGGVFGGVSDETIGSFDTERVDGMLDALNADFLGAGGADFDSISGGNTAFDQLSFASPDALQSVVGDHAESIFGGSLFGV